LPPFSLLVVLRVDARTVQAAQAFMAEAGAAAHEALMALQAAQEGGSGPSGEVTIYPAVPAPVARVAHLERWQMLLESASRPTLQALLRAWSEALLTLRERHRAVVRWALDVDPLSL
ncbi:MAG: primosomal protein N', partial [Betaproteobacteria bacterium]